MKVFIGQIQSMGEGLDSAIYKQPVLQETMLTVAGLQGDQQADKKHHGGPDRALCHYPAEHYAYWAQQFPEKASDFIAPACGENLSTLGMTEETVFIGDIYRWQDALIQVTQPRSPCYKLNARFGIARFSLFMQERGHCGWLYRVIQPGRVHPEAPLQLLSRNSSLSVADAIAIAFHQPFSAHQYRHLLGAAGLSASWCRTLQQRLQKQQIESFDLRLFAQQLTP